MANATETTKATGQRSTSIDPGTVIKDLKESTRSLSAMIPETWDGFARMHKSAVAEGAISAKFKELIALAIAVVDECDGCIAYHAKAAVRKGATAEEVAETLGVTLLMAGGPASVYAPRAWEAFLSLASGVTLPTPSSPRLPMLPDGRPLHPGD